jgi:hypothetical protein
MNASGPPEGDRGIHFLVEDADLGEIANAENRTVQENNVTNV